MTISCANNSTMQVSEETCEEVLASFSVVATTTQNNADRRRMIKTIRSMQEAEFGKPCAIYPHWQTRFESAYRRAL